MLKTTIFGGRYYHILRRRILNFQKQRNLNSFSNGLLTSSEILNRARFYSDVPKVNSTNLLVELHKNHPNAGDMYTDALTEQLSSDLEPLIDEESLPEYLLPSEKQRLRELSLGEKITNSDSLEEILRYLISYKEVVSPSHFVVAHIVIRNLVLKKQVDPKEIVDDKGFEMICKKSYDSCRNMEVSEVIAILGSLIICKVNVNSTIIQGLMQVLRKSLHLFSLKHLASCESYLLRLKEYNALSKALEYGMSLQMQRLIKHELLEVDEIVTNCITIISLLENIKDVSSIAYIVKTLPGFPDGLDVIQEYYLVMKLLNYDIVSALRVGTPEDLTVRSYVNGFINSLSSPEVKEVITFKMRNALFLHLNSAYNIWGYHGGLRHVNVIKDIIATEVQADLGIQDFVQLCDLVNRMNYIPVDYLHTVCNYVLDNREAVLNSTTRNIASLITLLGKSTYSETITDKIINCLEILLSKPWSTNDFSVEKEFYIILSLMRLEVGLPHWLLNNVFSAPSLIDRIKTNVIYNVNTSNNQKFASYKFIIEALMIMKEIHIIPDNYIKDVEDVMAQYKHMLESNEMKTRSTPLYRALERIFNEHIEYISRNVYYENFFIDYVLAVDSINKRLINFNDVIVGVEDLDMSSVSLIAILELKNEMIVGPNTISHRLPPHFSFKGKCLCDKGFEVLYFSSHVLKQLASTVGDEAIMKRLSEYINFNET